MTTEHPGRRTLRLLLRAEHPDAIYELKLALINCDGSVTAAAKQLDIPLSTLYDIAQNSPIVRSTLDLYGQGVSVAARKGLEIIKENRTKE